jgi:hypothetical protein
MRFSCLRSFCASQGVDAVLGAKARDEMLQARLAVSAASLACGVQTVLLSLTTTLCRSRRHRWSRQARGPRRTDGRRPRTAFDPPW